MAKIDDVVYWVRSVGPEGKERIPVYYKGTWHTDCADGLRGDVRARPVALGPGPFTVTYNPDDMEDERGNPL